MEQQGIQGFDVGIAQRFTAAKLLLHQPGVRFLRAEQLRRCMDEGSAAAGSLDGLDSQMFQQPGHGPGQACIILQLGACVRCILHRLHRRFRFCAVLAVPRDSVLQHGTVWLQQGRADAHRRVIQFQRHGRDNEVDFSPTQVGSVQLPHRAAPLYLQRGKLVSQPGSQKAAGTHAQRTGHYHPQPQPEHGILFQHCAKVHGKVGRFVVRDGGQNELLLHRITGGAGGFPQAGVGGADGVQLGVFGTNVLLHPQQHGAQVAVQVIPQGGVTGKVCVQRLFHFPDKGGFQIPQLHLLCAAPRVLCAQIGGEIQFQILRFLRRQGQPEGAVQRRHQPGSMIARRAQPSGGTALVAALPQLLNGQGAMDSQRQKACIRQMELLFLFKLLQSRPDLFGRFCIQQGREDLVFRHPSAEHLCQFLFRHTAAQQGRHHPPVGRSIPLQPDPHAGAAEHLHPVGV